MTERHTAVGAPSGFDAAASNGQLAEADPLVVVVDTVEAFVAVEEPGAEPLVGDASNVLIHEGGDTMVYGDGGAGKTTLMVDAACHLGAGQDWIGLPVPRALRVLLIEVEGPRALFRAKLRRKLDDWAGKPIDGRVRVITSPWRQFTFASAEWRAELARIVDEHQVDLIIAGPLTRIGMDEAGTLQQVRDFMGLVDDVRESCARRIAVVLIHHENRAGSVSGAWEGAGDTLLHVREAGNGHTAVYIQKARWASAYQGTTIKLLWAHGEGYEVEGERDAGAEVRELYAGDCQWRTIDQIREAVGMGADKVREVVEGDEYEMRTGEAARALGRHVNAKLYRPVTCPN